LRHDGAPAWGTKPFSKQDRAFRESLHHHRHRQRHWPRALAFAREGAVVVGCGLRVDDAEATVEVLRAAGGTMVSLQPSDLSKPAQCQALVDFAVRTFDRIDVLFNNAAMAYFNWLEDISDQEWNRPGGTWCSISRVLRGLICRPAAA